MVRKTRTHSSAAARVLVHSQWKRRLLRMRISGMKWTELRILRNDASRRTVGRTLPAPKLTFPLQEGAIYMDEAGRRQGGGRNSTRRGHPTPLSAK